MADFDNIICGPGLNPPTVCKKCGTEYHPSVEFHDCKRARALARARFAEWKKRAAQGEGAK
jgi:hypothetical protein